RQAVRETRGESRPCVIVAETNSQPFCLPSAVWWDIGVSETSNDPVTRDLYRVYDEGRKKHQRFYY
ncbi:MAG: hypothetical protein ACRDJ9_31280, partial [Dehalococcoidia bacterium]